LDKRSLFKRLCQYIGVASLILLTNYGDLLGGGGNVRLHVPFPLIGICLAHMIDILLLGLLLFVVFVPLQRWRFYPWVRLFLAIAIPACVIAHSREFFPFTLPVWSVVLLALVWAALLLVLLLRFPQTYRRVIRFGDGVGIFAAAFAFCTFAQLLWMMYWKPAPNEKIAAWATSPQPPREHPLLVWVVLDELSYDQVFEHRSHDLALPNFDSLRGESTVFTNVQPAGYKTAKILPSLLSGHTVDDLRYSFDNRFQVHYTDARGWHLLNGSQSVFHDAQKNGWRTAAVGWYNPYCPIYGDAIDDCYWTNLDKLDGPMAQRNGLRQNIYSPLRQMVLGLTAPEQADRDICTFDVRHRYQTHIDLEQHALQLLQTDQADFVFLHMAVPHSPNIWSRMDDSYTQTCDGSYLDNLALADRELGRILNVLRTSPRWKDTTLIVEGDHGWRINLWKDQPAWTEEDDAASRGVFDTRPAVIIHAAGQTGPETNQSAWPLLNVHEVVEQVVGGRPVRY
jgi:hypothetical protein